MAHENQKLLARVRVPDSGCAVRARGGDVCPIRAPCEAEKSICVAGKRDRPKRPIGHRAFSRPRAKIGAAIVAGLSAVGQRETA